MRLGWPADGLMDYVIFQNKIKKKKKKKKIKKSMRFSKYRYLKLVLKNICNA
jgi:hypothetical protein